MSKIEIDDLQLRLRQKKLIEQYQHNQACLDNTKSGYLDNPVIGQIAGRSVAQIDSKIDSKSARVYQSYLSSALEGRLRTNKSESFHHRASGSAVRS